MVFFLIFSVCLFSCVYFNFWWQDNPCWHGLSSISLPVPVVFIRLRTLSVKICFIVLSMFGLQTKTKVVEKIVKLFPISVSFELYVVSPHKNKSRESPPLLLTWKPHLTQPCSGGSRGGAHPPWFWVQIKEKPTGQVNHPPPPCSLRSGSATALCE